VKRPRAFLLPAIGALVVLAWLNRFIQDDAFISFRYARNLAKGLGLVWNPGERVEGYTNFLWTVLMAIPHKLGISPVGFSFGLGLILFWFSLYLAYRVAKAVLGSDGPALLAVVLLGTNYTFSAFATSGMETQLQAFLFMLAVLLFLRLGGQGPTISSALFLSLVLGLAVLTRPDSGLLVVVLLPLAVRRLWQKQDRRILGLLGLCLPFVAVVGPWLTWKLAFYGRLFPNTFYAKAPDPISLLRGVFYFAVFVFMYLLFLLLPWAVQAGRRLLRLREPKLLVLSAITGLWLAYVLVFGGDFMQFRMLVPVMPFLFILIAWTLCTVVRSRGLRAGLVGVILVGSVFCGVVHGRGVFNRGTESVRRLAEHVTLASENWAGIGSVLGRAFGGDSSVLIATTAAGAIPYYSNLKTLDMLGLNDPLAAKHSRHLTSHAGHRRIATLDYLESKGVSLVVGHPVMVSSDSEAGAVRLNWLVQGLEPSDRIPESARLIEIPIDRGYRLIVLYLVKSERVDSVIARQGWRVWPVPPYGGPR
jgi:arabinofuranosyltransferase